MKVSLKKTLFLSLYFLFFWFLPTILFLFVFTELSWYVNYTLKIFSASSLLFLVLYFKTFGFKKKCYIAIFFGGAGHCSFFSVGFYLLKYGFF